MYSPHQDDRLSGGETRVLTPEADHQPHHEESDEQEILYRQSSNRDSTKPQYSPGLLVLIAPALLAGIIVKAFDIAFLATSYARIASDLGHFKDGPWIMLTASICSAVFVPMYSYMLKSFGLKRMMIAANSAFAIGAGLCAVSSSFWQLLCSRLVLGFGSSGITLLSMIVINEIVGVKQLAIWESFVTCIEMGTSMAAGPLGAWIARRFSWHSVFLLELSFAAIGVGVLFVSFAKINASQQYSQSILLKSGDSKVPRIDVEGWILLVLAITVPLISVAIGDNYLSWTHPAEILLLICGPVFWCLFILFETNKAKAPIINMAPVFRIEYLRVLFQVFFVISTLNSIVVIIPPYIQVRAFNGPSFEDWALTCVFLGFSVGAIIGGYLVKSTSLEVQRIMLVNSVLLLCFCVMFATRFIRPESARYAPLLVAFGICTGAWQSCLLYATLRSTQREWWPQTLALYYLIETFGADLGMALMSTITRSVAKLGIRSSLGDSESTERIITDALRDLQSLKLLDSKYRDKVLIAFEHAMHTSFFLPCSMAAVVVLLAASMNFHQRPSEPSYDELPQADNENEDT